MAESPRRPEKGQWHDGEFEDFLADIVPALETSVGRLGVAGSVDSITHRLAEERLVIAWPSHVDRIVEEMR